MLNQSSLVFFCFILIAYLFTYVLVFIHLTASLLAYVARGVQTRRGWQHVKIILFTTSATLLPD